MIEILCGDTGAGMIPGRGPIESLYHDSLGVLRSHHKVRLVQPGFQLDRGRY